METAQPTYCRLNEETTRPLVQEAPTPAEMDAGITSLLRLQQALDRFPLLRRIDLLQVLQRATPAEVQRRLAAQKALQTARYLGRYNRACIDFWRRHGIADLDALDGDPDALRRLPIMADNYFQRYSPQDRLSIGDPEQARLLVSSGSSGRPKYMLMSQEQIRQTLPATRQFLRANWEIDAYDRVEVIVSTAEAPPEEPAWGAGYNMVELLKHLAGEYPHLSFVHAGLSPAAAARHIAAATRRRRGRTLLALYTYAPNLIAIMEELRGAQERIDLGPGIEFRFTLTGEAFPPYKIWPVAAWLGLIEKGLPERTIDQIAGSAAGRAQLRTLTRTLATGFGAAELKSGFSGTPTTMLWTLVMSLLERNEPARVGPFVERCFAGRPFPWSALKAAPHIYFLLGSFDAQGNPSTAEPPDPHTGPALVTSLAGEVVNCYLGDVVHIWDLAELAEALRAETGVDIRRLARALGLPYDRGDMILTNGRLDSPGHGGLDAAAGWWGLKLPGHHLRQAVAGQPELTGLFTAQSVDYADGRRVLWLHLEAEHGCDAAALNGAVTGAVIRRLEALNLEFRAARAQVLTERGEAGFAEEVQLRVLPFGHPRFRPAEGQAKHRYIYPPLQVGRPFDPTVDLWARPLREPPRYQDTGSFPHAGPSPTPARPAPLPPFSEGGGG
jgi:hypothetical protein